MGILAARRSVRGKKNTLISKNDAKQIFEAARPTGKTGQSSYDKIEKATMAYIRGNPKFKFTDAANKLLRKMVPRESGRKRRRPRSELNDGVFAFIDLMASSTQ